ARPPGQPPRHRARAPAGHRPANGPATGLPPPERRRRRGPRPRRRHPRSEGDRRPLRGLLQPRGRVALSHLRGHPARSGADLRGRAAERRHPAGAHARVPRSLPRARRRALADRRGRPRGPAHRRARRARRQPRRPRGRGSHELDHHRRGDRALHPRRPTRARTRRGGHPSRERVAGRGRPRVRRRGHARQGAARTAGAV
ncbi:MAG: RecR, partial [uncultured Solirubrobacterales bacterium]